MPSARDYDRERKGSEGAAYAYRFDLDVMHPFMVRALQPYFRSGTLLELGSGSGELTERLLPLFEHVTCVEASQAAVAEARDRVGTGAVIRQDKLEEVSLGARFDNVVLTHVLEHVDDPVRVLRRINDEWLSEAGCAFVVCPNAEAASRQIAVKMGLVEEPLGVTPAEAAHGHRRTYSLDTLERDVTRAGLRVLRRSGIFFKALANLQFDQAMAAGIVSDAYLEGCFQLGQLYPRLCSSILLVCERGAR